MVRHSLTRCSHLIYSSRASTTASGPAAFSSNAFIERPYRARYSSHGAEFASVPSPLPSDPIEFPPRDTSTPSIKRLRSPSSYSGIHGATPPPESDIVPFPRSTAVIRRPTAASGTRQGGFDFQRATRHTVTARDSSSSRRPSVADDNTGHTTGSDVTLNTVDRFKRRRADEGTASRSQIGNITSETGLNTVASLDPGLIHIENREEAMNVDSGRRRRLSLATLPLIPLIRRASRALVADRVPTVSPCGLLRGDQNTCL